MCMHCKKLVDVREINYCECGVKYCNKECQAAHWDKHKEDHNYIMTHKDDPSAIFPNFLDDLMGNLDVSE